MTKKTSSTSTQKHEINDLVAEMMWRFRPVQVKCGKPTLEGTLIGHVNLLQSVIMRRANRVAAGEGMTFHQWLALGAVAHSGDQGMRHSELGEALYLSKAPVSGMVDRLARAGWVTRKAEAEDRRAVRIVVTNDGLDAWKKVQQSLRDSSRELFKELDETDMYQLLSILGTLLQQVAEKETVPELNGVGTSRGESHE